MKRSLNFTVVILAISAAMVLVSNAATPEDTPKTGPGPAIKTANGPASSQSGDQPASSPASRPAGKVITMNNGLVLDLENRKITMDAKVCMTKGPLEFLLCKSGTKDYESLMSTKVKPSDLHICLLLLGLVPGLSAKYYPAEDNWAGREIPPRGAALTITASWKDKDGKEHKAPTGAWITNSWQQKYTEQSFVTKIYTWLKAKLNGQELPFQKPPEKWIFIGSIIMPGGGYLADETGEIISVSNFASAVIDVPFESSDKNAQRLFEANTRCLPPVGTNVKLTIEPLPDADKADYARAMLEIDRDGRMLIDGKPVTTSELPAWAGKFVEKHDKGQVFIRIDSKAPCRFITLAQDNLRFGGVRDFQVEYLSPLVEMLPLTAGQLKQAMEEWKEKFTNPRDYLKDPSDDAQLVMEQIDYEIKRLEQTKVLWQEYKAQVQKGLDQYRPTTRPGGANYRPPSE